MHAAVENPTTGGGEGQVVPSWSPPDDDGGRAVPGYIILRGTSIAALLPVAEVGDVERYRDTGLERATTCFYTVMAMNDVGEGEQSKVVRAYIKP